MHDNSNNGNEIAYASFTVSDFCVRIKSGLDQNRCGINNQNADDWAGSELKILHNDVEIKSLPAGFTDENICIDGFDIQNDLLEIRPSDSDDICIIGLFINENQLLVGKNNDQESFWMVGADLSCDDSQMKTDRIVIQNAKVASSICESPGFGWPCIHFRDDLECLGTSLSTMTHFLLTYDNCAKECIGTPGCIMFNWEYKLSYGSVSQCVLYSSGGSSKRCFHPVNYGVPISLRGFLKA